jgi:hypothetical protein
MELKREDEGYLIDCTNLECASNRGGNWDELYKRKYPEKRIAATTITAELKSILFTAYGELRRCARLLDLLGQHDHYCRAGCDMKADDIERLLTVAYPDEFEAAFGK